MTTKYKLYCKPTCPFSTKVNIFFAEAGLLEEIELKRDCEDARQYLEEKMGKPPTFPTLEFPDGTFMTESEDIINHFAKERGLNVDNFGVLQMYKEGVMIGYLRMVKHIGKPEVSKVIAGESS